MNIQKSFEDQNSSFFKTFSAVFSIYLATKKFEDKLEEIKKVDKGTLHTEVREGLKKKKH